VKRLRLGRGKLSSPESMFCSRTCRDEGHCYFAENVAEQSLLLFADQNFAVRLDERRLLSLFAGEFAKRRFAGGVAKRSLLLRFASCFAVRLGERKANGRFAAWFAKERKSEQ